MQLVMFSVLLTSTLTLAASNNCNITQLTTDGAVVDDYDNDDYNKSYVLEASATHNENNNGSNVNEVKNSVAISSNEGKINKGDNLDVLFTDEKRTNALNVLPRHQRAIAAVAEQKGLGMRARTMRTSNSERILQRGKRYLQFAKGSRISWRTTGKNNILKVNTLWGYGYGFRANFPFPGPEDTRRPFFKRDVLHSLADILDGHGLDGRACILKSYCTAVLDVDSNISGGMLFKMLKLIFTLHENEKRHFPYLRLENCKQILHSHCPLSFNSISPYTDDV